MLTYGLLGGLGLGFVYLPSVVAVGYYFEVTPLFPFIHVLRPIFYYLKGFLLLKYCAYSVGGRWPPAFRSAAPASAHSSSLRWPHGSSICSGGEGQISYSQAGICRRRMILCTYVQYVLRTFMCIYVHVYIFPYRFLSKLRRLRCLDASAGVDRPPKQRQRGQRRSRRIRR
jgi:hypothetical protein